MGYERVIHLGFLKDSPMVIHLDFQSDQKKVRHWD
jgi:hypothetical protein